jgi:peptide/nickel transport system substrate-binding protein
MIRHIRWQILLIVLGVLLAGILLSYQAVGLEVDLVPASGGVLVEGVVGQAQVLNPLLNSQNPVERDISALVFEGLTGYNERGQLVPKLASGWNVSMDGLVYTFWLRQDVLWQDGINFSADDVVYTIQMLQDPGYPGPADLGTLWREVEVEKLNRFTVTFTLPEALAPFLDYTTIGILPVHLLAGVTAAELPDLAFNQQPVGTGPFRVDTDGWQGDRLVLSANRLYREGKIPNLTGVEFRFFSDYGALLTAFEEGEINSVSQVPAREMPRARTLEDLSLYTSVVPRYTMVLFNLQDEDLTFLQDHRVRQALLYGLDRQALIADALGGQGIIADSPIYPASWAYFGDVQQYAFDLDRAAGKLDAAGWLLPGQSDEETPALEGSEIRTKEEQPLSFTLIAAAGTVHELLADAIATQWARLGTDVSVQLVEPGLISRRLEAGDFAAILMDVDMRGDPDLYSLWSESAIQEGLNYGGWRNREASELIEGARKLTSLGQRTTRYYHVQQIFADQVPALLLYYHTYTYGISDSVKQVTIGPLTVPSDRFATIGDWFLVWREVVIRKSSPKYSW